MSLKLSMTRRKLTIAERWQAIGISNTGMSSRNIAVQFNVNHTVIGRLIQRYHQTGTVNDRPRSGRPRLTFPREDRLLTRRTKQSPFTSATKLREHWPPGGRVCVRSHQQTAQCTFTSPKTCQTSLFVTTPPSSTTSVGKRPSWVEYTELAKDSLVR
jgi:IS30 family transposase